LLCIWCFADADKKMNGLIVFNSANDVVFQKLNEPLTQKIRNVANSQGLLRAGGHLDSNILLQIFSPIVGSQRIMQCQFDNAYSSLQERVQTHFHTVCLSGVATPASLPG